MRGLAAPKLVIFDLYGTLIQFGVMHHPFRKVLQWAKQNGRRPRQDDARQLMTINGDVLELISQIGINAPEDLLIQVQAEVEDELKSLTLFDDVLPTINKLASLNIPIVICSNLAQPYGRAIDLLLPDLPALKCLSYEVGAIKPEAEIYQWIINRSGVSAEHCLFVGDTFDADYVGPIAVGMEAFHLTRRGATQPFQIVSLNDVLAYVDGGNQ